jgi:hypothetical protein
MVPEVLPPPTMEINMAAKKKAKKKTAKKKTAKKKKR